MITASPTAERLVKAGYTLQRILSLSGVNRMTTEIPLDKTEEVLRKIREDQYFVKTKFKNDDREHVLFVLAAEPTHQAPGEFMLLTKDWGMEQ